MDAKLWDAAADGDEVTVRECLEAGATVDWRDQYGGTALHLAVSWGHTNVARILVESGWSLEARSDYGFTPLYFAAREGKLETVKYLLLRGTQIDTQDDRKRTPLHAASLKGHYELVIFLLKAGANQEIMDLCGYTAKHCASDDKTRTIFKMNEVEMLQKQFQDAATHLQTVKRDYSKVLADRQTLVNQLNENIQVKVNVEKRIDYIRGELKRKNDLLASMYKKLVEACEKMQEVHMQMQKLQAAQNKT